MMRLHWVNSEEMKSAIEALPAARNHTISYQTQTSLTIFEGQVLTPPASVEGRKYRLELTNTQPEKVADYDGQQAIREALMDAAEEINSRSAGIVRGIGIWASVRGLLRPKAGGGLPVSRGLFVTAGGEKVLDHITPARFRIGRCRAKAPARPMGLRLQKIFWENGNRQHMGTGNTANRSQARHPSASVPFHPGGRRLCLAQKRRWFLARGRANIRAELFLLAMRLTYKI